MATKTKAQKNNELTAAEVLKQEDAKRKAQQRQQAQDDQTNQRELRLYRDLVRSIHAGSASDDDREAAKVLATSQGRDYDADLGMLQKISDYRTKYPQGDRATRREFREALIASGEELKQLPFRHAEEKTELVRKRQDQVVAERTHAKLKNILMDSLEEPNNLFTDDVRSVLGGGE